MVALRSFKPTPTVILVLLLALLSFSSAHESCCKHKLAAQRRDAQIEFIDDPTDFPPDVFEGVPRLIADPDGVMPDYWDEDEDEDGPWEADLIANPEFAWKPKMMRNPNYVPKAGYWTKLAGEVREAIPWVTLGVLLVAVLGVVPLPLDALRLHLSGGGPFSALKAAFIGLATPLCSCGSLPIAAGLVANGVPLSAVVAFLTASQSAGLDSAAITWGLLGPTAAACRLVGAMVLAVAAGTALQSKESQTDSTAKAPATKKATIQSEIPPSDGILLIRFVTVLVETATEIYPLVIIGLAVSTAAVHYLPMLTTPFDAMHSQAWVGPLLLRIGVLASALPLQLCEHTTAALAAGIQKAGGSPGLAFAFLLSAPATNLPSLLLLTQTTTVRRSGDDRFAAARVAAALSCTALVLSYMVDAAGIDLLVEKEADSAEAMTSLPSWFVAMSPWLAGLLALVGLGRKFVKAAAATKQESDCPCPVSCGPDGNHKKHD